MCTPAIYKEFTYVTRFFSHYPYFGVRERLEHYQPTRLQLDKTKKDKRKK